MIIFSDSLGELGVIAVRGDTLLSDFSVKSVAETWLRANRPAREFEEAYAGWSNGSATSKKVPNVASIINKLDVVKIDDAIIAAASEDKFDGAMIALIPSDADLARLALEGYEPPEDLHLTLFFLGDAVDISLETQARFISLISANQVSAINARAFGASQWNPGTDFTSWVLNVGDAEQGSDELFDLREAIQNLLDFVGISLPAQYTPWSPHICIAYSDANLFTDVASKTGPVTFDRIRVAVSRDVTDIPLA